MSADADRRIAAVAGSDAGLHLVDIANPAAPRLIQTTLLDGPALGVEVRNGYAYVIHGSKLSSIDLNTGDLRQTLDLAALGGGTLTDIAIDGDTVYTLDSQRTLRAVSVGGGSMATRGGLGLAAGGGKLFVGGGVAYVGRDDGFSGGFSTVDVRDAANLVLLSGVDAVNLGGRAIAANGSGLAVSVGNPGGVFGTYVLDVVNVSDPTDTGRFVTRVTLPQAPRDLVLANGLAFVADGSGGLQIVNYLAADNKGVPPTVAIVVDGVDADPATPGIQVLEGRTLRILPTLSDDVQVRHIELLVNGNVVATDVSFPYELFAQAPALAAGATSGTVTVQVRAIDTGGNVGLSELITLSVVPDTFAPVVTAISVDEGARRFFVRTIDIDFDEPIDVARLDASQVQLLRAGADGMFDTPDDVAVAVRIDSRSFGQSISVLVDGLLPAGDYRLRLPGSLIADRAGNVASASIERRFTVRPASDVKATQGVPEIATAPSANPGQSIGFAVPFDPTTARASFRVADANGNQSNQVVNASRVDAAQGIAFFTVPLNAVSGDIVVYGQVGNVRTDFADGTLPLQIVPVVSGVEVQSVSSDGATAVVVLRGLGFVEGGNSEYRFGNGAVVVGDAGANTGPDVQQVYDPAFAQYVNGQVVLTVPLANGVFGPISVKTAGGTSAVFTVSLDRVSSTALSGTPADAAQASANPGQSITLEGAGLSTTTDMLLRYTDYNGMLRTLKVNPIAASADGLSVTLVVPLEANGAFTLQVFGSASQPLLQIVPVLTRLDADGGVVGAGFVEGGTTFTLPGATVTDNAANTGPDVTYWYDPNRGAYIYGGYASLPAQVLPRHGLGSMTVTTAGGTSAAIDLSTLRPGTDTQSVGSLADVAVAADGSLWTLDVNNPGHLLRINAGTGAVVQTITLDADTFGNQYTGSYAGLQVLPSATTLAGINVPAGSLLLISGYQYNSAPQAVAVNPATGEVIARLAIGPHGLVAGMLDPSTGQLLVLTTTDRLLALDRTTGAQLSEVALPVNLGGWAGLALDPDDGQLWIGSGRLLVQIDRAGTERRRIDLTPQGFTGEVSGLAFAADGSLRVASSQGFIQRVLPAADVTATLAPTLTQVIGSALNGVAAQANVAAANVGQTIELVGTNFGAGTQVLFNVRNAEGIDSVVAVRPLLINADGTRLQVVVPDLATTGGVRVSNVGTTNLAYGSPADAIHRRITTSFMAGGDSAVIRFADGGLQALNDESWGLDNVVLRQGGSIVFQDNFEAGANAAWSNTSTDSQAGFSRFAGRFNNTSQSLSVSGLVAGQTYELSFDLYAFDSWDGANGNPDQISVSVDGSTVLSRTVSNELADPQTVNASAALRLQIVPTLTGLSGGRPGEDDDFNLVGSGFMEGATTVTIGGVPFVDANRSTSPFDVSGTRNGSLSVVAPLTLDGPIRVTTEGGYAELPTAAFGQQPVVQFNRIVATVDPALGLPADATQPAAVTGQTIVLQGQGFTSGTLVQFQGVDDSGRLGTLTRSGTVGNNGTTLTVVVPALARTGNVTVLGSGTSLALQVLPTLRAAGGSVQAGQVLLIEGSGLTRNDLAIQVDGRGVGSFSVQTVNDGPSASYADQQLLRIVLPAGVGGANGGVITVSTAGGTAVLRTTPVASTALPALTPADAGNTLATAQPVTLGLNQNLRLTGSIGTATDVDLYQLTLAAGEQLSLSVTGNQPVALRLFAADGTPLVSTQRWVNDGTVLRWTAPAAGVVYVGLSGYNNTTYDPAVAGSGTNGGYTGNHTLVLERVAAGNHRLGAISSTALSGTPASSGVASANTGQTITLSGLGLLASDRVVFTLLDDAGRLVTSQPLAPASVAADGSSLTVVVPVTATTGMVRLERDTTGVLLQIVPTLSDVAGTVNGLFAGGNVTLTGTGFAEGATTVLFGSQAVQDVGRSRGLDVYGNNSQLNLTVPEGLATGPLRVSTVGGTSAAYGLVLTGVQATASTGSPLAGGQASANPGQTVTLLGSGFDLSTDVVFTIVDANGQFSERLVRPAVVNQAGTQLQVTVPLNAVTGSVRLVGDLNGAALPLQIVPVVTGVQVQSVSGDGATAVVVLTGRGFVEGNNSEYRFGAGAAGLVITDAGASAGPDVQQIYDQVFAQYVNGQVVLTVPLANGVFGPISVKTAGGTSAVFTVSLDRVSSTALSGTPADAAQASANPGQSITLEGAGLSTATDVLLRYTDYNGALRMLKVNPIAASADGLSATLVVPLEANGAFTLQVFGSASQPLLQIVPVLTRLDADGGVVGAGFVEGGTTFTLPGATVIDNAANTGPDVTYWYDPNRGAYIYGGYASLPAQVLPRHGLGSMTVTTAGGTSAAIDLSTLRPGTDTQSVGSLADVAVAADGSLWTLDVNNPGHLLRINAGTGAVVQTITLDADTFGNQYTGSYAGLQVLPSATTLAGINVPAGSLLLISGYQYNSAPQAVAVNPANGEVIARLAIGPHGLVAGMLDPSTGQLMVLTTTDRLLALDRTTGAQLSEVALPVNLGGWAGLALDPDDGQLWIGSGRLLVQIDRAGTELRRIDLTPQGFTGEVSGLAFAADGSLRVASSQGYIQRVVLPAPVNRVAAAPGARLAPLTVALPDSPQTADLSAEVARTPVLVGQAVTAAPTPTAATVASPAPALQSSAFRVTSEWLRREGVLRQAAKTGGWGLGAAASAQRLVNAELLKPASANGEANPPAPTATAALPPLVGIGRLSPTGVASGTALPQAWADPTPRAAAQLLLRAPVPSSTARGR